MVGVGGFVGAAMLEVLEVIAVLQWEIACIQMCVMCDVCWCCVDGEVEKTEYGTRGAGGQGEEGGWRERRGGGGKAGLCARSMRSADLPAFL